MQVRVEVEKQPALHWWIHVESRDPQPLSEDMGKWPVPSLWLLTCICLTKENLILGFPGLGFPKDKLLGYVSSCNLPEFRKASLPSQMGTQVPSSWPALLFQPSAACEQVVALTVPAKCHTSLSYLSRLAYLIYVILPLAFVTFKRFPGILK